MRNNQDRLMAEMGANMARQDADFPQQLEQEQITTGANPAPSLSFIVPTEFVSLPSQGKFYPQNHPLHGKDTIEIKQMTAKEEDILTSRNLLKKGVALDKLIQSLVVDKRINTDTLTLDDRGAIILAARISAYGADYSTSVACPNCNEKSKNTFNLLEKLEQEQEENTVSVDQNGFFDVVLPKTKWNLKCRALNGQDEKILLKMSETKKNSSDGDSFLIEQMKMFVFSINSVSDRQMITNAINAMPASDSKFLRSTYQNTVKGIDMKHTFNCSKCDFEGELEVPLTVDFFWFK
jgi:hypothetical protein